jgi:hypothetical protein
VDADRALKRLFGLRAPELLGLTGDRGARVVSRFVPEVAAVTRRLDFVMKLQLGRELYLRHLEFEMRFRPVDFYAPPSRVKCRSAASALSLRAWFTGRG